MSENFIEYYWFEYQNTVMKLQHELANHHSGQNRHYYPSISSVLNYLLFPDFVCLLTSQVSPPPRPHSYTVYPSVVDGIPRLLYPRAWPSPQHLFCSGAYLFSGMICEQQAQGKQVDKQGRENGRRRRERRGRE